MSVDHSISVKLDDRCLHTFPECDADGYTCSWSDGRVAEECIVACVAGRAMMCGEMGPECTQRVGSSDEYVPVVCISRDEP